MTPFPYPFAAFATGLALFVYVWTWFVVGRARKAHGVDYPATQGPDAFNRVWRAHANTLEALPQFLPSLWLFAIVVSDLWAGVLALVWAAARIHYVKGYAEAPAKRTPGFTVAFLATATLLLGALGTIAWQWLR
jgi:glutathione S-transferase